MVLVVIQKPLCITLKVYYFVSIFYILLSFSDSYTDVEVCHVNTFSTHFFNNSNVISVPDPQLFTFICIHKNTLLYNLNVKLWFQCDCPIGNWLLHLNSKKVDPRWRIYFKELFRSIKVDSENFWRDKSWVFGQSRRWQEKHNKMVVKFVYGY